MQILSGKYHMQGKRNLTLERTHIVLVESSHQSSQIEQRHTKTLILRSSNHKPTLRTRSNKSKMSGQEKGGHKMSQADASRIQSTQVNLP